MLLRTFGKIYAEVIDSMCMELFHICVYKSKAKRRSYQEIEWCLTNSCSKMQIAATSESFSFKRAQFLLLSDFPRNIDTCQRKQTWSARLIGKNSAESHFVKLSTDLFSFVRCDVKFISLTF